MTRTLMVVPAAVILAGCGTASSSSEGSGPTKSNAVTSRVEWTTVQPPLTAAGVIDYAKNEGDLVLTSKDAPGEIHALFIGLDTYLGAKIDGKMRWAKEASPDPPRGTDRFLPGPRGTKPNAVLAALEAASSKVDQLGSEKVRGVDATHYKAHLAAAKLGKNAAVPDDTVIDAWIDEDGLARRIRKPDGTFDFYDYGVHADIEAPSADDVVTEDEFDKLMTKECAKSDAAKNTPVWCFLFGTVTESSGSTGYGPTTTMPTTTTDGK